MKVGLRKPRFCPTRNQHSERGDAAVCMKVMKRIRMKIIVSYKGQKALKRSASMTGYSSPCQDAKGRPAVCTFEGGAVRVVGR